MKYTVDYTKKFHKQYKKIQKQGKDLKKLDNVIMTLANGEKLDEKHLNHQSINNKYYKDCYECHIEPDWLLIYKYQYDEIVLLLLATGSHSELFD